MMFQRLTYLLTYDSEIEELPKYWSIVKSIFNGGLQDL